MTAGDLVRLLSEQPIPCHAEVLLETDTLKMLDLTSARLELTVDKPPRLVLEGLES